MARARRLRGAWRAVCFRFGVSSLSSAPSAFPNISGPAERLAIGADGPERGREAAKVASTGVGAWTVNFGPALPDADGADGAEGAEGSTGVPSLEAVRY